MLNKPLTHKQVSPRLVQLGAWRDAAERLVFYSNAYHWSNSITLWILLNALDTAITWLCLSLGMSEENPFLEVAAQTHGEGFMLSGKMILALLIGVLLWRRGTRRMKGGLNLGMTLIVIMNCLLVGGPLWSLNYLA